MEAAQCTACLTLKPRDEPLYDPMMLLTEQWDKVGWYIKGDEVICPPCMIKAYRVGNGI